MRIAYISSPWFADVDVSYLREASKHNEIDYYLTLMPSSKRATIVNIDNQIQENEVLDAVEAYPVLKGIQEYTKVHRFYVLNIASTKMHSLSVFALYWRFYKKIKDEGYDVIHTTSKFYYYNFHFFSLRNRILLSVHDPFPHSDVDNFLTRFYYKINNKFLKYFLIFNQKQKEEFVNYYGLNPQNVFLSRLSTYDYLHLYDKVENIVEGKYLLFFGRISKYKGLDYLLSAMQDVHGQFPGVNLIVAGKGDLPADFDYESMPYVKILNKFISNEELAGLISNSLCVVCPYIDATQSGVIMSAFAYDKPVIATNVGGLPEMVHNNEYGIIVPPKDVKALADAISKIYNEEGMATSFSANIANAYHNGLYSWKAISKELDEIYKVISKQA